MKKVLIIGAGFLQSFVIKKAKQLGYEVLAVDADSNAVGFKYADRYQVINIVDEKACLKYAQSENIDGVLTAATDYGVLTAAYIAETMGLPGVSYKAAQLVKNKYLVRKCLFENHVDDTYQVYEVNSDTNIDILKKELKYPVIVKPCDGSGSRGTSRVDSEEELKEACEYAMQGSITHRAEIEPFIFGNEYGAESLVTNGQVKVMSIMKKWMTKPPYYAELGHAIPNQLPVDVEDKAVQCVEHAIKALGIVNGSVNMDMIITDEGTVHIIDIGARMGGNMIGPCVIPYGTGFKYIENMIKVAVGEQPDWNACERKAVATKLFAFKGGVVKRLPDFCALEKEYNVEIYHHLQVGDIVNEYHTNLDGCGYIIAIDQDVNCAEAKAALVLKRIEQVIF